MDLKVIMNKVRWKSLSIKNHMAFLYLSVRYKLKIMSSLETVEYIQKNRCSVARYGDGELNMILKEKNIGFQKYNQNLSDRLKEVLFTKDPNLLICLPHMLDRFNGECLRATDFWKSFSFNNKQKIVEMLRFNHMGRYRFGDTQLTRPYIDYDSPENAKRIYKELKKLWNGRDILIVEGSATRMGTGNDLFDNASSIRRIICPAENAFASYEEILSIVCEKHGNELVLIALGPTATVLASDLSKRGIWAIDVGHLDVEYEWFLSGTTEKSVISGKYVNEVSGGSAVEECRDETYLNQIIARVLN